MESASHSVKFYSPGSVKFYSPGVIKDNKSLDFFSCIVNNTVGKQG